MTKAKKTSKFIVVFKEDPAAPLEEDQIRWFWKALTPDGRLCPDCAALGSSAGREPTMCVPHFQEHRRLLKGTRRGLMKRGQRLAWDHKAEEAEAEPVVTAP